MLKKLALAAGLLSLLMLSGCASLDSSTTFKLDSANKYTPRVLSSSSEQSFYGTEVSNSFYRWILSTQWAQSYEVNGSPLRWIPEKTDEAFSAASSRNDCSAWIEFKSGEVPVSTTTAYIYRLVDSNGTPATSREVADLWQHLSSDLKRQGWIPYEVSDIGSADGNAGQMAWYVPSKDGSVPPPIDDYVVAALGEPNADYISYRLLVSDRGDGYVSLYVSTPCAPVKTQEYEQLQGTVGTAEIDIIEADSTNPDNNVVRP